MSRQRSDLSENIKISSTPEAERYFARKNKTMGERYEKGELDIEVFSVDNIDEEKEDRNIEVLEVLDKEGTDGISPNIEDFPVSEFLSEDNFVEVIELGDGEHLDVLPVHLGAVDTNLEKEDVVVPTDMKGTHEVKKVMEVNARKILPSTTLQTLIVLTNIIFTNYLS